MMDVLSIIISLIFGAVLSGFIFYILRNKKTSSDEEIGKLGERIETSNKIFADQFKQIREETAKNINEQIEKVVSNFAQMKEILGQVQNQVKEVSSFQTIFKSPKLT